MSLYFHNAHAWLGLVDVFQECLESIHALGGFQVEFV